MHWQQVRQRDLALADYLLTGQAQHLARVAEADSWLLEQNLPDNFDDGHPDNILTLARQKFLKLCAALAAEGFQAPEGLSVAAFHAAVGLLVERGERG